MLILLPYFIVAFVSCMTVVMKFKKYDLAPLILAFYFLAPCFSVFGVTFDSTYVFLPFVFIITIIPKLRIRIHNSLFPFFLLIFIWIVSYSLGWLSVGLISPNKYVISILGLFKNLFAIFLLMNNYSGKTKKDLDFAVGKVLSFVLYLNAFAVFLQWIIPLQMYEICSELYYISDSSGYTSLVTSGEWGGGFYNGHYYRYFGLFETPMTFSCFLILVIALYTIQFSSQRVYFKRPYLVLIIDFLCGISTQCKIYLLVLPVIIILYILYNFKRLSNFKLLIFALFIFSFIFLITNMDNILFIREYLGNNVDYLIDPISAFATRFGDGENQGYILKTLSIALNNWFTGVGPVSLDSEPLSDSSFVVLLHNGGVLAIASLILFYSYLFFLNIKYKENYLNLIYIILFIIGLSRTELIFGSVLIFVIFYMTEENMLNKNERRNRFSYCNCVTNN